MRNNNNNIEDRALWGELYMKLTGKFVALIEDCVNI